MKTKLIIEIETKDNYDVLPEVGQSEEEDFKGEEKQKELKKFREKYTKDLHNSVIKYVEKVCKDDFEDNFLDILEFEELYIEGWDELDEYGIKIKVEKA